MYIYFFSLQASTEFWGCDADKFRPDRFLEGPAPDMIYQVFGTGQRSCIGERLAVLQIKLLLAEMLRKYRFVPGDKTVIPPQTIPRSFVAKSPHDILLKVSARK